MERLPEHVPPELVTSFSLYSSPEMVPTPMGDPQAAAAKALLAGPPIVYTPLATRDGVGAWVVTRAEDQRRVLQDGVTFSIFRNTFSAAIGESWPLIPLEIDPPDHSAWRSLLNPLLSPRRVVALGAHDRKLYVVPSRQLIIVRTGPITPARDFDQQLWLRLSKALPDGS